MSIQRHGLLLPTCVLASIAASMAVADGLPWQEHIHESGNFRVTMPGELISKESLDDSEIESTDDEQVHTCHAVLKRGEAGASFMAVAVKHSADFRAKYTPAERLSHRLDQSILESHNKSPEVKFEIHREPRVAQGYSGEYVRVTLPGPELWECHTLAFYAGEIYYAAEVIVASKDSKRVLSPSDIEKFLSSFHLLAKTFELDGTVTSISSTPDGGTVLLGTRRGRASFWNSSTGMPLRDYQIAEGHWDGASENYPELQVAIDPAGKHFVAGTAQGSVALWDIATGKEVRRFCQDSPEVMSVSLSRDGRSAATRFRGDSVRVWECGSGKQVARVAVDNHSIDSFALSPDGRRLAIRLDDHARLVENKFQVYDVPSGRQLAEIKVPHPWDAAFSPDGGILVTGGGGEVRLWSAETGQELQRLDKCRLPGDAQRVAFSNDGTLVGALGVGYDHMTARVWNLRDNRVVDEFNRARRSSDDFTCLSFTPDNQWLLLAGFDDQRGFVHPLKRELAPPGSPDSHPPAPQGNNGTAAGGRERRRVANDSPETGGSPPNEVRTWVNATGTRTLRGEFVDADETHVKLRLENGKLTTARLALFSDQDQKFVRERLASRQTGRTTEGDPPRPTRTRPTRSRRAG